MRGIKFRAWSKSLNKMLEGVYIDSFLCWDKYAKTHIDIPRDSVFLQYTGLKGKNGKEIYEGDVVLLDDYPSESNPMGEPDMGVIECRTGAFGWMPTDTLGRQRGPFQAFISWFGETDQSLPEVEVIGNVWETPALIGGNK